MLEVMTGENGVVLLDIRLYLFLQATGPKHPVDRRYIEIVLVLGWLHRLWLDQDRTLEADLVLVFNNEVEEPPELLELAFEVRVEQRLIAFAPAPEHIVFAAEFVRDLQGVLHLRSGVGKDVGIRIGGGTPYKTAIGEKVRCAPEEANLRLLHLLRKDLRNGADVAVRFLQCLAFGRDVSIVEAKERHAKESEEFEGDIRFQPGVIQSGAEPRPVEGLAAERISAGPVEGMPIADRKTQMVF